MAEKKFSVRSLSLFCSTNLSESAMDEEYEVIVLVTGLKECILSGFLSVDGVKHFVPLWYNGTENNIWLDTYDRMSSEPTSTLAEQRATTWCLCLVFSNHIVRRNDMVLCYLQ
ncbi:PREDICTED: probable secretory pathway GDP dissociation inhibitor 1 [Camelina sativa]|uniref:Probable secretory pathway GDP dissociation inhibitor 1 n=1 Tax=Camelina sativa TaxID=90675 RepID=A0ABM1QM96_CAMSA|nr:PREDICTED: probable secretory pathway GDP dissociation inhibitor 1 [Camelina sativa]